MKAVAENELPALSEANMSWSKRFDGSWGINVGDYSEIDIRDDGDFQLYQDSDGLTMIARADIKALYLANGVEW